MSALASKITTGAAIDAVEAAALDEALAILKAVWAVLEDESFSLPVSIAHVHLGTIPIKLSAADGAIQRVEDFLRSRADAARARLQGETPTPSAPAS